MPYAVYSPATNTFHQLRKATRSAASTTLSKTTSGCPTKFSLAIESTCQDGMSDCPG